MQNFFPKIKKTIVFRIKQNTIIKNLLKIPYNIAKIIYNLLYSFILNIHYLKFFFAFQKSLDESRGFSCNFGDIWLIVKDSTKTTSFEPHYIYHTAWAARALKNISPAIHIDISSAIYFSTINSAYFPIIFYDYRPANVILNNLKTEHADLTNLQFEDNSIESLSCMHVIEHIGLGRYGDKIDTDGDLKAISELKRVLAPSGNLLFVVPLASTPKIVYNAHRIYSYKQILNYFSDFKLEEFALIPDNALEKGIIYNPDKTALDNQQWACGCFWFTKQL